MSGVRGHRWLRRAAVALVAAVTAALLGEAFFRAFPEALPETAQLRLHWQETFDAVPKIDHPQLGFLHPPGHRHEVQAGDFGFTYTTDAHGFRNQEPWGDGAEIVAVGDSQAFGFGVDDHEGWVALLDDALGQGGVVNLGVNGSAPQQQLEILERHRATIRPETIVFSLFPGQALGAAGDFQDWLDAGRPMPLLEFTASKGGTPAWKQAVLWGTRHSRLLLFLRSVADRVRTPYPGVTVEVDGAPLSFTPYIWAGHAADAVPGNRRFDLVLDAVEEAHALAQREGMRFLVVLFPTKDEVYLPLLGRPVPPLTPPFAEALKAAGIPFIDLTPILQRRAERGERLFLEVDIHPNELGYAVIADAVARRLHVERRLADARSTRGR